MKTVYIVEGMSSEAFENNSWIEGVFDSEEKTEIFLLHKESEEDADDYIYTMQIWEVQ